MKWIALIGLMMGLMGCTSSARSSLALTPVPLEGTSVSLPTRSVKLASTSAAMIPLIIPSIVKGPIGMATPIERAPTPTLPECPPLPAPTEIKTQAAVQHFEHGLMLWLQERDEIWTLIASPLENQFYWRVLPNLWTDSQPESDPAVQPSAGRLQPVRGFGMAWRLGGGSHGPQRADLGWAIDQETGFNTTLIYFPQGFYSPDCTWMPKSGIYELTDERGVKYQFVGAGGIAKIVTGDE